MTIARPTRLTGMRRARLLLVFLLFLGVGQLAWYGPRMPAVMATHYNGAGIPNGTMSRSVAAGVQVALLALLGAVFLGLPLLLRRMPAGWINLPHRDYWLAPERRKETLRAIEERVVLLGSGALSLLLLVSELSFRANLNPPPRLPTAPLVAALGGFVLFLAGWTFSFYRRFPRPRGG